jgi:hypothetical protein
VTLVAMSSDRSLSCFREDTGISTTEAPFSTACSTTSTALCRERPPVLSLSDAGTATAQQELADVRRHRVLARELAHQILADDVAIKRVGGDLVQLIELHGCPLSFARALLRPPTHIRSGQGEGTNADFVLRNHDKAYCMAACRCSD